MRKFFANITFENYRHYVFALFTGSILALAFPPLQLGFIAYFSLIPLFFWVKGKSPAQAFKTGYWWGFGFQTALLFWIVNATILGGLLTFFFVPLYSGFVLMLCSWLYKRIGQKYLIAFPFIWTAVEFIRSLWVLGFIWMSLGYTQTYYYPLIQYAEFTGHFGVTFWICVLNVLAYLVYDAAKKFTRDNAKVADILAPLFSFIAVFFMTWIYGSIIANYDDRSYGDLDIAMIQGHIDMDDKTNAAFKDVNFKIYEDLTLEAAKTKPDLIIWPETATATYMGLDRKYNSWVRRILRETETPILAGSLDYEFVPVGTESRLRVYNSVVFYQSYDAVGEWFGKIKLVPFGEWFPYEDKIPFLKDLDFGQANFTPGKDYKVFDLRLNDQNAEPSAQNGNVNSIKLSSAICFESSLPGFIREFTVRGAQMLFVVTNDNWFGRTTAHYQHAQFAVFRAIENRVGVAHCSNSGISVIVDPLGKVTHRSNVFVREYLAGNIKYAHEENAKTFYTKYGDIFSLFALLVSIVFTAAARFRNKARA